LFLKEGDMGRASSTNGEKRNVYRILEGKLEGRRSLGRPRRRWIDILICTLERLVWMVSIGSIWLRIGTSEGLL
jgi:hypothetical protein